MSKRDILTVTTLAAHLANQQICECQDKLANTRGPFEAERCASDAMALQRLGRRARRNAAKRWIHPENRDTREEIEPYMEECRRISAEASRVLAPYGMQLKDFAVGREGITIFALPGENAATFGRGFLI